MDTECVKGYVREDLFLGMITKIVLTYGKILMCRLFIFCSNQSYSCEHYIPGRSKDHFHDLSLEGLYDIQYLEAVMAGDLEEAAQIEEEAQDLGYGPLVECTTVSNFSTQKTYCCTSHLTI
jgi:hypothetical protein